MIGIPEFMENSFTSDLSLADYANYTGRSLSTFNRDFRRIYGMTPGRWITRRRLEYARELLQRGAYNVSSAASEAGFTNLSHFSRVYRSEYGITPAEESRRFRNVLADNGVDMVSLQVTGALGSPFKACYYLSNGRALIEIDSATGLSKIPELDRDPMKISTFGAGQVILDALDRGARDFYIGTRGCVSSDAGTGMLSSLGVRFLDAEDNHLKGIGENLEKIASIDMSGFDQRLHESMFSISCEAGPTSPSLFSEAGFCNFARLVRRQFGIDLAAMKGAAAAGGLAGSLAAFLRANLSKPKDQQH